MTWLSIPASILPLALCLSIRSTTAASTSKRDSTPPPPATLFVPLAFDSNRRYTVNVSLPSNSSQLESFAFALTTSTGYSSVAAQGCSTCGGGPTYSLSPNQQTEAVQNVSVLGGSVVGPTINQTCNLQLQNGSSWSWPDPSLILANQPNSIFGAGTSGVLGIGTNARQGMFNETPMAFWLKSNPSHQNFSYGLALNPPNDPTSSSAGTLHWLAPDENSYEGDISWKALIASNGTGSINTDSYFAMDSWSFQGGDAVNSNITRNASLLAAMDPISADLVFPHDEARMIYTTIPGSQRQTTVSSLGSTIYSLPCNTTMQLTLTFGTVSVTLTEAQLVHNLGNSTCQGVLQEWAAENVTEYFLGSTLMSKIYLIYQVSNSSSAVGFALKTSTSPPASAVSIAGVVLGGLAFLLMLAISVVLFIYWRRRRVPDQKRITPFMETSPILSRASFHSPEMSTPFSPRSEWGIVNDYADATNRNSKRSARTGPLIQIINSPIAPSFQTSQSDHSRGNELFIRVSPVSPLQRYEVLQQDDTERNDNPNATSMNRIATLPPYTLTDSTGSNAQARGRL
ncbi:aspartic peptidase domain-containing protein [Rhodocollybia butyracea]|uniref:Aspartic peptidase domain-containing protein n=1 Tax=Rhodocollybia butyracea TaxID=206335 RepID=A0A9P5UFK1_9AGAR|nr:aspartic peptidase domain-containing protein [Rhodocollybia butyracea]